MVSFQYTVKDPEGLHIRPAGSLVKCAQGCTSTINIEKNANKVDAKRLFAVMGLCVKQNDTITFLFEGENEQNDCETLKSFCYKNI